MSDASGQSGLPGDSGVSPNLRYVNQLLVADATCDARMFARLRIRQYAAGELCAGPVTGNSGQDSCGGDSGGPLVFDSGAGNNPRYLQVGIVSSGTAPVGSNPLCGGAGDYGIYVRMICLLFLCGG
jgi:secreted trypsin-like serine protease